MVQGGGSFPWEAVLSGDNFNLDLQRVEPSFRPQGQEFPAEVNLSSTKPEASTGAAPMSRSASLPRMAGEPSDDRREYGR